MPLFHGIGILLGSMFGNVAQQLFIHILLPYALPLCLQGLRGLKKYYLFELPLNIVPVCVQKSNKELHFCVCVCFCIDTFMTDLSLIQIYCFLFTQKLRLGMNPQQGRVSANGYSRRRGDTVTGSRMENKMQPRKSTSPNFGNTN